MRTILVSAYACEPLKGSEQGVGWNWVLQMAKHNYLHVVTRANNREFIEAHLPKALAGNITFHYYDTNKHIKSLKNKAKGLYFYYLCWQLGIISVVKKLKKEHQFDYAMHLTMGSLWMPTFLPFFNMPFIWGPVGGGDGEPNSFLKELPFKQRMLQYVRIVMNALAFIHPSILIPCFKAKVILARTQNSANVIPKLFKSKVRVMLETAMEPDIFEYQHSANPELIKQDIRLITTGRLMPSKNIIAAVRCISYIPASYNIVFTIIGSGIEKEKIEKEIVRTNQENRIKIISEIPRTEVLKELSNSDIYLFPSLREGGCWALMEAMAIGLPVVCLNWSGMEIITDDTSAIRLPVTNPKQMPKDIANAICKLIDNPELRLKMGNAGRERIKNVFNWDAKGTFMENLLNELDNSEYKS
ncbi:glycosyltransferase family 4 protein [Polaribacter sp. IC073]|uniref:glycosyltransferase family 4 protein n=1 Tax=Polaribacter sp. IC073 TaxID=2508540 RepID=UPI0011BD5128|nr:glycosyltransferase [Polaribacter sp. IC073]TXD47761.1 glycosyltransferase [Polaribacter sp. IC073]